MSDVTIAEQLARAQAGANLLGRLATLRDSARKTAATLQLSVASRLMTFADPADPDAKIYTSFDLPPTGGLDYLRNLTPVTKVIFDGLTSQYRQDAFTVAGVTDQRVLGRIRDRLTEVVATGGTAADFRAAIAQLRSEQGVEELTAQELDSIFAGYAQKAYSVGRYEQMNDPSVLDALPFWQYWTVGDDRVRPEHRVLDGFCALAIDPVWRKIYPPCGYGCRCAVVPLSADEAPDGSSDPGMLRLPALAMLKVPQPGFNTIFV